MAIERADIQALFAASKGRGTSLTHTYVDLFKADDGTRFLHVEKVEKHTVASLFRRCAELSKLAGDQGVSTFDGFDVGNVDGSPMS